MDKVPLELVLNFTGLLQKFRTVERRVLVKNNERSENDGEHSFSLAMLAWYMNDMLSLGLDTEKLLTYALSHDLVEVYAGDTFFYSKDENVFIEKKDREAAAAHTLKREFGEFAELHETIEQYTKREDAESKFIYALDKIEPVLSIYLDGGRTWRKDGVTIDMLTSMKLPKVALDATVESIFKELVSRLKEEEEKLFKKGSDEL